MTSSYRSESSAVVCTREIAQLVKALELDLDSGLSEVEAKHRKEFFGPNLLRSKKPARLIAILWQQLKSVVVLLLVVAATVSFVLGDWVEGLAILAVLVINSALGFTMELRAVRSMEALRKMGRTKSTVIRDGQPEVVDSEDIVPGDIVTLEAGDVVTADIRLLEANQLSVDESALTGESLPVEKRDVLLSGEVPIAERINMLFKGTSLSNGSAQGVVVSTGMSTELGLIAKLTEEAVDEETPLEKRLDKLGQRLAVLSMAIVFVIGVVGYLMGKDLFLMLETAIALAVATIPEGLPIVATIALAKGMFRMSRQNALINRLSAVESLGATSVILSDKTGTLTRNKMVVSAIETASGFYSVKASGPKNEYSIHEGSNLKIPTSLPEVYMVIRIGVLCSNASLSYEEDQESIGDPMEVALLEVGRGYGLERKNLLKEMPEVSEEAFDPISRMMATVHNNKGKLLVAVKGAPEAVISSSKRIFVDGNPRPFEAEEKETWQRKNTNLASMGLRVLGMGFKEQSSSAHTSYEDLVFVGLVGLSDPPREGVLQAIESCHRAGIRVIMVTGDQEATAKSIGAQIGIDGDEIYSRVSPEQKLRIVQKHQEAGAVVAMTGDGVNDAPALKKADIGIAMGERGTQVARDASDMILKDDNFVTIVSAILQGRIVFSNIRRFVVYLLSCNISEVMVILAATISFLPLPLLPIQILFLNLVTDVFPALALGMGEGDPSYLKRPPRKSKEPVLTKSHWIQIVVYGGLITFAVLGAFWGGMRYLGYGVDKAVTVSFSTIAFAQLFHVFNMRDLRSHVFNNDITRNPFVWGAVVLCTILIYGSIEIEVMREVMSLVRLTALDWVWVMAWSLVPLLFIQIFNLVRKV